MEPPRSKSRELDQIRTEVADINQAYFCAFLRSSATVALPTYQSPAGTSSKTTQMSSFGSCNTSLIASVTRFEISSFRCCERPSTRRMFTNGMVPPGSRKSLSAHWTRTIQFSAQGNELPGGEHEKVGRKPRPAGIGAHLEKNRRTRGLARGNPRQNAQAHQGSRPGRRRGVEVDGHSGLVARRHHLHRRILQECREAYLRQGRGPEGSS